ncbi:MAG: c-type cytochrome [Planctomycetes bacterium]|nr:c-type cytochrome [Planctomycetota bacterium]
MIARGALLLSGSAAALFCVLAFAGCDGSDERTDDSPKPDETPKPDERPVQTDPAPDPAAAVLTPEQFDKGKFIYFNTCAGCHGTLRGGATGPELSPEKIAKLGKDYVKKILNQGTPQGMPSWGAQGVLSPVEISLMADYLSVAPPQPPMMNRKQMEETWQVLVPPDKRPAAPAHSRNWENFFGVILRDAGKVAIIDGDTKERVALIDSGFAVHILRSSASGRYFYSIGRDAKVTLIDLWMDPPQEVARIKVGYDARSIEVSKYKGPEGDFEDRFAVVGCYWPPHMVVLDGLTLQPRKVVSTSGYTYDTEEPLVEARVASIVASHHSPSWIVCVKELGYVWMVDYSDVENLRITQIEAERFLHDGGWDSTKRYFLVAANMRNTVCVIDAKEQKLVARVEVGIKPHPGRGANFVDPEFGPVWGTVHLGSPDLCLIGTDPEGHPEHAFKNVRTLPLLSGGSLFLKTHPESKHLWADHVLNSDLAIARKILVWDRTDFSKEPREIQVADHGRVVHFEYDKSGKEVWVSVWDQQGEIVVYDDETLEEKCRIRGDWLRTPTGKFNVYNTAHDVY